MKLWDKGKKTAEIVDAFTVGNDRELDNALAKYDVMGSVAHAKMLKQVGIISETELADLLKELEEILELIAKGEFSIPENFEDIHSYVEYLLTEKLGDTGKKIHTARSRNDQVLVDMHLYLKDEIIGIKENINELFELLISLADKYKEVLLPGYTHFQIAMPSSFGMWFSAYAEALIDDVIMLNASFSIADQNPLGSAAGYGSSFPIDRKTTTDLLNFKTMKFNSVAAQMSRGKVEKTTAFAIASVAGTLSKLSMDIVLYMSRNFGFIRFPDELTTGSSIMPHKKNPDVFELIRAKTNKLQAVPNEMMLMINNLPSGYHRDFQLLKEPIMLAINEINNCLNMSVFMLEQIKVNRNILDDDKYDYLFSVERVNEFVQAGHSFREAYKMVGQEIESGRFKPDKNLNHTHIGSVGNLALDEIKKKMREVN